MEIVDGKGQTAPLYEDDFTHLTQMPTVTKTNTFAMYFEYNEANILVLAVRRA